MIPDPIECAARFSKLTNRQREVLLCVIQEGGQKQAARLLDVHEQTVKDILATIQFFTGKQFVRAFMMLETDIEDVQGIIAAIKAEPSKP